MITGTDFGPEAQVVSQIAQIGVLPDAPLAMPKQRLERAAPLGRGVWGVWGAMLRPFFARTGRSEG